MRRLAWLALLLAACSAQPVASPYSAASSAPSISSCRLPVRTVVSGGKLQPGFLTVPGSTFTPATNAQEGLYHYNRQVGRWVAWAPEALFDDGSTYAYVEGDHRVSRVHVVDLRTNVDRVLAQGGPWRVIGVLPDAVYVERIEYLPESPAFGVLEASHGLWKVQVDGSGVVELTNDTFGWLYVSKGAAWASSRSLNIAGAPSDVLRLDLQTMKLTTWFAPDKRTAVLAIDASGVPMITSEADSYDLWRVPAPDGAIKLWSTPYKEMGPYGPVAVDGKVIWFSSQGSSESGIYRYSEARGLEVVARFSDRLMWVAGPCA